MPHPLQDPAPTPPADARELCSEFSVRYRHRIIFTDGVLHPSNPALADAMEPPGQNAAARAAVFIDSGVAQQLDIVRQVHDYFHHHASRAMQIASPTILVGGESAKRDSRTFEQCIDVLRNAHLDRHSYAIAIGGGAVLDAVGFAASVVHRGVRHIRIPTTVLAQADAGVGVKNGINYRGSKNFLGCFSPPTAVLNDFTLLSGLPPQDWRDGTVEAVKVALIRDADFFRWIEDNLAALRRRDPAPSRRLIFRCAQLHFEHITTGGDPFERGSARPLDFGHWAAHKLEQLSAGAISHGHAVAVGIAIDVAYARTVGLLSTSAADRIFRCLHDLGFTMAVGESLTAHIGNGDALLHGIEDFREHLGGPLSITLLRDIGQPVEVNAVDRDRLRDSIAEVLEACNHSVQSTP